MSKWFKGSVSLSKADGTATTVTTKENVVKKCLDNTFRC